MTNTLTNLTFNYPSTAKIKIKRENVLICDDYPFLFGVKTDKLVFTVPRKMVILTDKHLYIPKSMYERVLENYYKNIKNESNTNNS